LFAGVYVDTAGTYRTDYASQSGCDSAIFLMLTVNPLPVVTFTWDSLFSRGDFYRSNGEDTAIWSPCNPQSFVLTGGNPAGGHYSGTGVSNDTFYAMQTLVLIEQWDTIIYTYEESNHCGPQSVSKIIGITSCEGISEIIDPYLLQIYPNPASDYLTVTYSDLTSYSEVEMLDMLGRVITTQPINAGSTKTQFDTRSLTNGLYFVRIISDNTTKAWAKFNIVK
jgi:hypothetical protein